MCNVKHNERYPKGCRGWATESKDGCIKCVSCKYSTKAPVMASVFEDHPKAEETTTYFDTWARQFVPTKPEERL